MCEQWAPIDGFPGYSVSSPGRVRSEQRTVLYESGKTQSVRERIMSPAKKRSGHLTVMLHGDEDRRLHVHRLVAAAFIGAQPSQLHEVAHRDGDPSNNAASNLRWATRAENHGDKVAHGTHNRGEAHPLCKLTTEQVKEIRVAPGWCKDIARAYGISFQHVWSIKRGLSRSFE